MKAVLITTQEIDIPRDDVTFADQLTAAMREELDPGNLFWEGLVDHAIIAAPPGDPDISITFGGVGQVLGVPLDEIRAVTLDGRSWIEVFGHSLNRETLPSGARVVRFRVAQVSGGDKRHGLEQGATVTTVISRILGVAT